VEPLTMLLDALRTEAPLSAFGRLVARHFMVQLLVSRLRLEALYRQHPEIDDEQIVRPIVVAGLPRTGTTHLFNLLSQDPSLRWMPYWETLEPFPNPDEKPGRDGRDPRIARGAKSLQFLEGIMPLFSAMHEFTVEGPHEEIQLLAMAFTSVLFESSWQVPSYGAWYKRADRRPSYAYLKRCMKALQFLERKDRWLMKTPEHLMNLGSLAAEFPDATFVQTHRDPVRITASLTVMIAYGSRLQQRGVDTREVARYWSARTEDFLRASVADRHFLPDDQVLDVHFNDFMADMKGTVRQILERGGSTYTPETDHRIDRFLAENPKGKHGLVDYRLEDLGIDPNERREALSFYAERFGVAQP
ncbi:MAG: sulfotransferase, partial [Myxococcota bacterium]